MSLRHLRKAVLHFLAACVPRLKMVICLGSLSEVPDVAARPSRAPGFPAISSLAQTVPKPLFFVLELLCGFCARIISKP